MWVAYRSNMCAFLTCLCYGFELNVTEISYEYVAEQPLQPIK